MLQCICAVASQREVYVMKAGVGDGSGGMQEIICGLKTVMRDLIQKHAAEVKKSQLANAKSAELPLLNGWLFKAGAPCVSTASLLKFSS